MRAVQLPKGLRIEPLHRSHRRSTFDCGPDAVNDWLKNRALQHQAKHLSSTKVLVDADGNIASFYTLVIGQVDFSDLPAELVRRLPRRVLPVVKLAWLGVDRSRQGEELGSRLLAQALVDCHHAGKTFSFVAVLVDGLTNRATAFYRKFDFRELPGQPNRLFLSADLLDAMIHD